jgi:hypothetical protein
MRTAFLWVVTRPVVVIPFRRFGTTYRSLLQGSKMVLIGSLKKGPMGCPETSLKRTRTQFSLPVFFYVELDGIWNVSWPDFTCLSQFPGGTEDN